VNVKAIQDHRWLCLKCGKRQTPSGPPADLIIRNPPEEYRTPELAYVCDCGGADFTPVAR
jgi:hypothetical protein